MRYFALIVIALLNSCGNTPLELNKNPMSEVFLYSHNIKSGGPAVFEVLKSNLGNYSSISVEGYMKCCASPLEIDQSSDNDKIYLVVKHFWAPGTYVIKLITFDEEQLIQKEHTLEFSVK